MSKRTRKRHVQLSLEEARKPTGHGGWRPRAGRPKGRNTLSHDQRPTHVARNPVHVTLRLRSDGPPIARDWLMTTIRGAIKDSQKADFRIVEFNVLSNHIHFLAEASGPSELSRGVQGFAGRVGRRLNKKLKRSGKLFATRFHARAMTSPRDVRNTLRPIANMTTRRRTSIATGSIRTRVRRGSTVGWSRFAGLRGNTSSSRGHRRRSGRGRGLGVGWRRYGALRFDERPA